MNLAPLFWHQGLFLQPQHFQHQDSLHRKELGILAQNHTPCAWGIQNISLHQAGLKAGLVQIDQGIFIFQDGTRAELGQNAEVGARSCLDQFGAEHDSLKVYLGLRKWDSNQPNVTVTDNPDQSIASRFRAEVEPETRPDLHQGGADGQVRTMRYSLRVFWETEVESLQNYLLLPVLVLQQGEQEINILQDYIAPCTVLSGSDSLLHIFNSIKEQAIFRCRQLEEYKSPAARQEQNPDFSYLNYLLALSCLSRYVPCFEHLHQDYMHPWELYGLLAQMAGELSVFSERVDCLGRTDAGIELLPEYDHLHLFECFSQMKKLLDELLDEIIIGPEHIIEMQRDEQGFLARIPLDAFDSRNHFFLVVRPNLPLEQAAEQIAGLAKLGCDEFMATLVPRALPGIGMQRLESAPPGLPKRLDSLYYSIERGHKLWEGVQRFQNLRLYWDSVEPGASAELIVIRKDR